MSSKADDSFLLHLHEKRVNTFLSQDRENGFFDVEFDVGGKPIFAHKFVVASISTTFKELFLLPSSTTSPSPALITIGFTAFPNATKPIQIKNFSYDDFFDFLCFGYTGDWSSMSEDRILGMLKLGLTFHSKEFVERCDIYLSKISFNVESFYKFHNALAEFVCLLPLFKKSIKAAMKHWYPELLESELFKEARYKTVKAMVCCQRAYLLEANLYMQVLKWVHFQASLHRFLTNDQFLEFVIRQLSQILPFIHFEAMSIDFLLGSVVKNGYLVGYDTLSDIVRRRIRHDVEITDVYGKKLSGTMFDRNNLIDEIKSVDAGVARSDGCEWDFGKQLFFEKSKYSMIKGKAKYCLLIKNGKLVVTSSPMNANDYFLAELYAVDDGFVFDGCKISVY